MEEKAYAKAEAKKEKDEGQVEVNCFLKTVAQPLRYFKSNMDNYSLLSFTWRFFFLIVEDDDFKNQNVCHHVRGLHFFFSLDFVTVVTRTRTFFFF